MQASRSTIIADEDTISVSRIVEDAGGSHGVHNHGQILVASSDEYVDVRNIIANQVSFLSYFWLDGKNPDEVWDGIWYFETE